MQRAAGHGQQTASSREQLASCEHCTAGCERSANCRQWALGVLVTGQKEHGVDLRTALQQPQIYFYELNVNGSEVEEGGGPTVGTSLR